MCPFSFHDAPLSVNFIYGMLINSLKLNALTSTDRK